MVQHPAIRDRILSAVGASRSFVPGLDLVFGMPQAFYDSTIGGVAFYGKAGVETVRCIVSEQALQGWVGDIRLDADASVRCFRTDQSIFERAARRKYLTSQVTEGGDVVLAPQDLEAL